MLTCYPGPLYTSVSSFGQNCTARTQATRSLPWGFISCSVSLGSKIKLFFEHGFCEFHAVLCESAHDKLPRDFSGIYTNTLSQPSKLWSTMTAGSRVNHQSQL